MTHSKKLAVLTHPPALRATPFDGDFVEYSTIFRGA